MSNFENVLQYVHGKHIQLPEDEVRRNQQILAQVTNAFIEAMKTDRFFNNYYCNRIFYGGSYYDGLKVGHPEEFDLGILLKIPKEGKPVLNTTNKPGFLSLRFTAPEELSEDYKKEMLDENCYLSTFNVLKWMQSIFEKAKNKFPAGDYIFKGLDYHVEVKISSSGPARTLVLSTTEFEIKIDFVPCIEFAADKWPSGGYKKNPVPHKSATFFIVPKSPEGIDHAERYWRLSFQEQERFLIKDKRNLKPTLRLFKRLRDVQQHKAISSYCIKTIFLWEDEKNGEGFWNGTMTDVFVKMLDIYIGYIESGNIPYFWNKKNNLISLSPETRVNMKNHLRGIQKNIIAKYRIQPTIICKYLGVPPIEPQVEQLAERTATMELEGNGSSTAAWVGWVGAAAVGGLLLANYMNRGKNQS